MFQLINVAIQKRPVLGYESLNFNKADGGFFIENGKLLMVI